MTSLAEIMEALHNSTVALEKAVLTLTDRVTITEDTQRTLAKTQQRQTRNQRLLTLSLVIDLALSVFALFLLDRVADNSARLDEVQQRTSNEVLCPLYVLFIGSIESGDSAAADANRDGKVTAKEQAAYTDAITVIRDGYDALDCNGAA